MLKDYDTHFTSADYSHRNNKDKAIKRRKADAHMKNRRMQMIREGQHPTWSIVDEKRVRQTTKEVVPAHYEEERVFYILKNEGDYMYTDKNGVKHFADKCEWRPTGRLIFRPQKIYRRTLSVTYMPCEPYIRRYSLSNVKAYAKKMTAKKFRRSFLIGTDSEGEMDDVSKIPGNNRGYKRTYDYGNAVW